MIVAYEISGTATIYRAETNVIGLNSVAVSNGEAGSVDLSLLAAMDGFADGRLTVSVADTDVSRSAGASYSNGFVAAKWRALCRP